MEFPLLEESVEVRGHTFRVRELTMDQLMPLTAEGIANAERSKLVLQASVTLDGAPVDAGSLPAAVFSTLSAVVSRVNGLDGSDDAPGNA